MLVEFANLTRLWWALLAIPIILLFILRVRLRRQEVATLLFWEQLLADQPPRAWWQRLRNLLALLLQLAFLALVVGALLDPLWSWQRRTARQIVYVIDNSASMSARDEGETGARLDRARNVARRMTATLRQQDSAAIVTAGGLPQVTMGLTRDTRLLAEAIDRIDATDSPTQLSAAVELAKRLVADDERRDIIVLTDGADAAVSELAGEPDVDLYGFGSDTDNVAITSFQARRSIADATSYQVLIEVTNFSQNSVQCQVDFELEGNIVDVIPLTLDPEESYRQTLDHSSPAGGRLIASLDTEDALVTDNQAVAVLPYRKPIPVLLVTPGNLFLQSVFESIPNITLTVADQLPDEPPPGTITVIHQTALEQVPDGPVIVVDPTSGTDLWTLDGDITEPIVARQAPDSPLLAHVRLQNIILTGAKQLQFTTQATALLESPSETMLYAQLPRDSGHVLVLSASLADGDLPLRIAFPVMIKNAIEFFLGDKGELRPSLSTGEVTSVTAVGQHTELLQTPSTAESSATSVTSATAGTAGAATTDESLAIRSPGGNVKAVSTASDTATVGPFDRIGLWVLGPSGTVDQPQPDLQDERLIPIAVNLANPEESDLRPRASLPDAPQLSVAWGGHSLWFYLSLLATVGICAEWFLYHRRIVA